VTFSGRQGTGDGKFHISHPSRLLRLLLLPPVANYLVAADADADADAWLTEPWAPGGVVHWFTGSLAPESSWKSRRTDGG